MREHMMQIRYERSTEKSRTPDDRDELLRCRMAMLGLDLEAIERDYGTVLNKLTRRCVMCGLRIVCALDLERDHHSLVWEAYCPNSEALNALGALTEAFGIVRTPG